jgi:ornithine cyclodeaminase/alanine dehydrogenase-like protein (mu-crystallin family)
MAQTTVLDFPAYENVVLLSDADVRELVPVPDAVEALEDAFRDEALGDSQTMKVTRLMWDGGRMQALGGHVSARQCAAVKSWVVTASGAQPTLVLFSTVDGRVLAIMEAAELGRIRTGATSGVATRHLARSDAAVLLLIGTGRQAMTQARAATYVRDFSEILVAARDPAKTAAFADELGEALGVRARAVASVADGAAEADVIITVTSSATPVLMRSMVKPSAHVNAVGAVIPHSIEVDPALFAAGDLVVIDSVTQAMGVSAEITTAIDEHGLAEDKIVPLHAIVSGERAPALGLTIFKSLGVGLADCAIAELAWRRTREA